DEIGVTAYGLQPKHSRFLSFPGCILGWLIGLARLFSGATKGSRPDKWKKLSDKVKADFDGHGGWTAKVTTKQAHAHDIMFEAILRGPHKIKQKQCRGHKRK